MTAQELRPSATLLLRTTPVRIVWANYCDAISEQDCERIRQLWKKKAAALSSYEARIIATEIERIKRKTKNESN